MINGRNRSIYFALTLLVLCLPGSRADLVIDLTYIGNAGNPADTTGHGSVNYNYYIGTYEVTVAQYTEFLNAVAASDPNGLYNAYMGDDVGIGGALIIRSGEDGSYAYTAVAGKEDQPVRYVDFYDSVRFCNWLSNGQGSGDTETGSYDLNSGSWMTREDGATWVLPTEEEWYKAAFYDASNECYYDYPNGSDETPAEPTDEATPRDMNFGNDPWWHGYSVTYTSIGETTGHSPYGVYDMGGNVEEWTESFPPAGSQRLVYGGTYGSDAEGISYKGVIVRQPDGSGSFSGFRVAYLIPEPGTVVLLVGGGLFFLLRRKMR